MSALASESRSKNGWPLAFVAFLLLALTWVEILAPVRGRFGIGIGDRGHGAVVESVSAGTAADRAGIRPGDAVDLHGLGFPGRLRLQTGAPPETHLKVRIGHAGVYSERTLVAEPQRHDILDILPFAIDATVTLFVVAVIVLRLPSLATMALVLYGCGAISSFGIASLFAWLPDAPFAVVAAAIVTAFSELPLFALLVFVTRFPAIPSEPLQKIRMRIGDGIFLAAAVICAAGVFLEPVLYASWRWFHTGFALTGALAVGALATWAYLDAPGEARRRMGWVLVGFGVSALSYVTTNVVLQFFPYAEAHNPTLEVFLVAVESLQCGLGVALAYAVLRHRVLDIGFALNRTLVYAIITTTIVLCVAAVDWLSARLLAETRLEVPLEATVAIAFAIGLNWFHAHIEDLVDRTIFRERHLAEKRLLARIRALSYATAEDEIDEALVADAGEIFRLASAAIYRREFGGVIFKRAAAAGWPSDAIEGIEPDSLLVRTIVAADEPVHLGELHIDRPELPSGPSGPSLAIPVASQHELIGIVLYGNGPDGAVPDPDEVELLAKLASAAGSAYSIVDARRWRLRALELEAKLAAQPGKPIV